MDPIYSPQPTAQSLFSWMAWTQPVAIFFVAVGLMLVVMTVWELRVPTIARKGFLPLTTTRGDRLFIGLLTSAYINLAWTGFTDMTQWGAAAISAVALAIVMRWG
jgi:predicted small integral membrane protein